MNGCIIKGTPIVVDVWQHSLYNEKKVHFLSHLHADHTKGLTSQWSYKFYTSPPNYALLKEKFQFNKGVVVPLELNEPHIIFINNGGRDTMTVTLIDANHVPGAVMFLFQGSFGNILYCGDMRYYSEIFEHPILHQTLQSGGIDQLFLDNTFCHPNYDFPSRKVASQQVLGIIEQHPNHMIKLGVRTLGKEDLLEEIAQKFNELIHVDEQKYKQLKILKRPNVYTTDISQARIHAIALGRIHRRNHEKWNKVKQTISIRLTAIEFGVSPGERPMLNVEGVFTIPYSDHSSWSELNSFVAALKPRKIVPIVIQKKKKDRISIALNGRDDMSVFDNHLSSPLKCFLPEKDSFCELQDIEMTEYNFVSDFVGQNDQKQSLATKKRRKKIQKGVLFSPMDENSVCNINNEQDYKSSDESEFKVIDENINEIMPANTSAVNSLLLSEYGVSNTDDKNIINPFISHNQECVPNSTNIDSFNPDISHTNHNKNSNRNNNRYKSEKGSNLISNAEYKSNDSHKHNVDGEELLIATNNDSDTLLMLLKNEPNIEVDKLLSKVELLTESLRKVDCYLNDLI